MLRIHLRIFPILRIFIFSFSFLLHQQVYGKDSWQIKLNPAGQSLPQRFKLMLSHSLISNENLSWSHLNENLNLMDQNERNALVETEQLRCLLGQKLPYENDTLTLNAESAKNLQEKITLLNKDYSEFALYIANDIMGDLWEYASLWEKPSPKNESPQIKMLSDWYSFYMHSTPEAINDFFKNVGALCLDRLNILVNAYLTIKEMGPSQNKKPGPLWALIPNQNNDGSVGGKRPLNDLEKSQEQKSQAEKIIEKLP
jgi:hypothetical protein